MPQLWSSHNDYQGHRLFVFGTGPSLLQMNNLEAMKDEYTWVTNRFMEWGDRPFQPDFHSLSEPEDLSRIEEYGPEHLPTIRFAIGEEYFDYEDWIWVCKLPDGEVIWKNGMEGLGDELGDLPSGSATPLTAGVQLGAWMGFDPIYLLGCDNTTSGQVYAKWQPRPNPHPNQASESAQRCESDMAAVGRTLIDCTPNGRLGISYKPLEEVLGT